MKKNNAVRKKRQNLGFSLVELLVTFTLISLISGVGFASFSAYSQRQIVVQATANLKQTVDLARFNAVSFVKPGFCDTGDLQSYKVRFCHNASCLNNDNDYEMVAECSFDGEGVVQEGRFPDGVVMGDAGGGGGDCGTLVFNVLSSITEGTPCEVEVSGYNNDIILSVDEVGHASY